MESRRCYRLSFFVVKATFRCSMQESCRLSTMTQQCPSQWCSMLPSQQPLGKCQISHSFLMNSNESACFEWNLNERTKVSMASSGYVSIEQMAHSSSTSTNYYKSMTFQTRISIHWILFNTVLTLLTINIPRAVVVRYVCVRDFGQVSTRAIKRIAKC